MLVAPRGKRSRRSYRLSPTSARYSLEESGERASPRLGRPGMRSRDNGSPLEGANARDPPEAPPRASVPLPRPLFTPAWRLQGFPGAGEPSPALWDSLGNPWRDARSSKSPGVDGGVEERTPNWNLTPPFVPAPNPDLLRATFSLYPSVYRRTSLSAVPEGSTSPNRAGDKGIVSQAPTIWKALWGPAKDVIRKLKTQFREPFRLPPPHLRRGLCHFSCPECPSS